MSPVEVLTVAVASKMYGGSISKDKLQKIKQKITTMKSEPTTDTKEGLVMLASMLPDFPDNFFVGSPDIESAEELLFPVFTKEEKAKYLELKEMNHGYFMF